MEMVGHVVSIAVAPVMKHRLGISGVDKGDIKD